MHRAELSSAILYLLVTYPLVTLGFAWEQKKRQAKTWRKNALLVSLGVVAVILAVKLGFDASSDGLNYYKALEVGRHAGPIEIRKSYKQISRVLHPDKSSSPNAEEEFQRVKTAYDVLMDEKLRDIYNRFGIESLSFDPRHDELRLLSSIGVTYIFWLVVIFITTVPQGSRASRTWAAIVGVAILVVEVCFRLTETAIPAWLPSHLTEAELVVLLHRLFPGILVALRCVSESFYVDVDEISLQFLQEMELQQKSMSNLFLQLKSAVALSSGGSGGSSNKDEIAGKLEELSLAIDDSSTKRIELIEALKTSVADPASGYYWLVLVVMYAAAYFTNATEEEKNSGG